jgi:hypothetical protein
VDRGAVHPGEGIVSGLPRELYPRKLVDRHDRLWVWDVGVDRYRHDNGTGSLAKTLADLSAEAGPLGPPDTDAVAVDDRDEITDRLLALEVKATPPGNVFEWAWEYSRAMGYTRRILLTLAFHADEQSVTSYAVLNQDPLHGHRGALPKLRALGEIRNTVSGFRFPAYEDWLAEQAPTDLDLAAAKAALDSWRAT